MRSTCRVPVTRKYLAQDGQQEDVWHEVGASATMFHACIDSASVSWPAAWGSRSTSHLTPFPWLDDCATVASLFPRPSTRDHR